MNNYLKLFLIIAACELVGLLGAFFTVNSIPTWYAYLNKPFFAPPNWVFGPVWTILYCLMGISFYLVIKDGLKKKAVRVAGKFFLIQLALNFIWTPVFFGLRSPGAGLVIIVAMFIAIILTMKKFISLSKNAFYLLIPYLMWVGFATLLNAGIFFLNK